MLIEVHREYNSFLPLEMQEQHEDWFEDINRKNDVIQKQVHNWIRDEQHERKEEL